MQFIYATIYGVGLYKREFHTTCQILIRLFSSSALAYE